MPVQRWNIFEHYLICVLLYVDVVYLGPKVSTWGFWGIVYRNVYQQLVESAIVNWVYRPYDLQVYLVIMFEVGHWKPVNTPQRLLRKVQIAAIYTIASILTGVSPPCITLKFTIKFYDCAHTFRILHFLIRNANSS